MCSLRSVLSVTLVSISMMSGGCTDTQDSQSRDCDNIDKIADREAREELASKCIRAGKFTPSSGKTY